MPRKLRCLRPINPILMMGRRGHQLFQRISNNVCAVAGARNIGGGGPGPAPSVADFIAYAADNAGVLKGLVKGAGSFSFARATEASVTDHEGLVKTALVNELRFEYGRRVENLATGLVTETVTVINGGEYQLTILGANGATAVCSGAFTGTLTANGVNRISWPNGVPKTATSASLTITVTGTLTQMLLENVSGQSNQNPSEYVSVGVGTGVELVENGGSGFSGTTDWTTSGTGTLSESGGQLTFTAGTSFDWANYKANTFPVIAGKSYAITVDIAQNGDNLRVGLGGGGVGTQAGYIQTSDVGVFSVVQTAEPGSDTLALVHQAGAASGTYVLNSLTVKEVDQGVNVDGVKYFNYANNNSVSPGGVVSESKGATFSTVPRALYESFATTNLSNTNDDLTGGAETVTISSTGNHTLSVGGSAAVTVAAGTATGSGFGQATEGNPVTFNITGTGTVTLTLNSGTLGTADKGWVLKQVEVGAVATSFVESPGGGGTRTADDGSPSFDIDNWSQTEGTWYCDIWWSNLTVSMPILTLLNSGADNILNLVGTSTLRSFDGTTTINLPSAILNNDQHRVVIDFTTNEAERSVGSKDISTSGSWLFADGAQDGNGFNSQGVINIFYGGSAPVRIQGLSGFLLRQGKQWIEDNI